MPRIRDKRSRLANDPVAGTVAKPSAGGRSAGRRGTRDQPSPPAPTVGGVGGWVLGSSTLPRRPPVWPPDVFAVVGHILSRSGAYLEVLRRWLPGSYSSMDAWQDEMRGLGEQWRRRLAAGDRDPVPAEVVAWWHTLVSASTVPCDYVDVEGHYDAEGRRVLLDSLLRLCAVTDEACAGAGILLVSGRLGDSPILDASAHAFYVRCFRALFVTWWRPEGPASSLCEAVHPARVIVLPKLHTSPTGVAVHSLTHHLALHDAGDDVTPVWRWLPSSALANSEEAGLRLLLLPWPEQVAADSFTAVRRRRDLPGRPEVGYFTFDPGWKDPEEVATKIADAYRAARAKFGRIDAIVLPELALDARSFAAVCARQDVDTSIIAGVRVADEQYDTSGAVCEGPRGPRTTNRIGTVFYLGGGVRSAPRGINQQTKHHRWRLTDGQIRQYGLERRLDPSKTWWEWTDVQQRILRFWSFNRWLNVTFLLCEDLARQEPVSRLVRAVGPNLIITLLADGPQRATRWAGRYGRVFTEDPGCSVLTLTSLGMACRSTSGGEYQESRVVALWQDSATAPREIRLAKRAVGIVLSLRAEPVEEIAAGGRSDRRRAARIELGDQPKQLLQTDVVRAARLAAAAATSPTGTGVPAGEGSARAASRTRQRHTRQPTLEPHQACAVAMLAQLMATGATPAAATDTAIAALRDAASRRNLSRQWMMRHHADLLVHDPTDELQFATTEDTEELLRQIAAPQREGAPDWIRIAAAALRPAVEPASRDAHGEQRSPDTPAPGPATPPQAVRAAAASSRRTRATDSSA